MKANVLIVEDMPEMSALIASYLKREGMQTLCVESAELALQQVAAASWDLILLDINLPGMDGLEFLQHYRKQHSGPVLIVSARGADEDIITGLGYGADEFIAKPFSPRVLVARVRAMLRRAQEPTGSSGHNTIRFGPFSFDAEACLLKKHAERIPLSAKEFKVLQLLLSQAGKLFSPEAIYEAVWPEQFGEISAVAVYIQRLRRKIEDNPAQPRYLETVFGMGYRLNTEVSDEEQP